MPRSARVLSETGDSCLPEFAEIINMFSENHNVAIERFRRFHMEFSQEACMDVMEDCKSDDNHEAQIQEFLQIKGIALMDISKPEYLYTRKELIIWLQENTVMSGRKLAEVTGINRETIRKILANK
jgi:predicted HTH transcriptional regulator